MSRTIRATGQNFSSVLSDAAAVIRGGGLVAFPTETVYGLGANASDADAVAKIFAAKGRPSTNPLIVHVNDKNSAKALAAHWPKEADLLLDAFAPGPLSIVVKKNDSVPSIVSAGMDSVAIRIPSHPVARALIEQSGCPLAAPSANTANAVSPTLAEHVQKSLANKVDMILDAGPSENGLESTVVDLTTSPPRILRPGPVTRLQIESIVGAVTLFEATADEVVNSPGMMKKHYSPNADLRIVKTEDLNKFCDQKSGESVGCITYSPRADSLVCTEHVVLPDNARAFGSMLYAALHALDEKGVNSIVVEAPPASDDWYAVRDRLDRAAN